MCKVKRLSHYRPGQAFKFQVVESPRISRHSAHEGSEVVSRQPYSPAAFTSPPPTHTEEIFLVLVSVRD